MNTELIKQKREALNNLFMVRISLLTLLSEEKQQRYYQYLELVKNNPLDEKSDMAMMLIDLRNMEGPGDERYN